MIHWATASEADAAGAALETPEGWLAPSEAGFLAGLRFPKRRRDWLLGRLAAKRVVQSFLAGRGTEVPLAAIAIEREPSGAPLVRINGAPVPELGPGQLSLSHSHGVAVAALSPTPGTRIGVDLERIEPRAAGFVADFLSDDECRQVARAGDSRDRVVTTLWSAKEAALKALGTGLDVDTRRVRVSLGDEAEPWRSLTVIAPAADRAGVVLEGSSLPLAEFVLTYVTSSTPMDPAFPERKA